MLKALKKSVIALIATLVLAGFVVFEGSPLVSVNSAEQVEDAQLVNHLLEDIKQLLEYDSAYHDLVLTTAQINSLLGFLKRAHQPLSAGFYTQDNFGRLFVTYEFTVFGITRYLNFELQLASGDRAYIERAKIGKIPLPGNALLSLTRWGVNQYTRSDVANIAYNTLQGITFSDQNVTLLVAPTEPLLQELKLVQARMGQQSPDLLDLKVGHYLDYLVNNHKVIENNGRSLAPYIREIFLEAKIQSQYGDPVLENKAAILALTIFLGDNRFIRLFNLDDRNEYRAGPKKAVTLNRRRDLALHFLFSASIELLSAKSVSIAVGEFKELMDRAEDGTGYSFVDLAADKAGIAFAIYATEPNSAEGLQTLLAQKADESLYFPSVDDLPEGLKMNRFAEQFKNVDSPEYQAEFELIIKRINELPISQL